jgi:hypothetical protein
VSASPASATALRVELPTRRECKVPAAAATTRLDNGTPSLYLRLSSLACAQPGSWVYGRGECKPYSVLRLSHDAIRYSLSSLKRFVALPMPQLAPRLDILRTAVVQVCERALCRQQSETRAETPFTLTLRRRADQHSGHSPHLL